MPDQLRPDGLERPLPGRLGPAEPDYGRILAAHARATAEGADGYLDPTSGLFVMTARYLAGRGWCCGQGCRHCPYEQPDQNDCRPSPD